MNPAHALAWFATAPAVGFVVLGSVFLVVTGAEALYADMGHFERRPIQLGWFAVVLPGLLLNNFGQGALLLSDRTPRGSRSSRWRRTGRCCRLWRSRLWRR